MGWRAFAWLWLVAAWVASLPAQAQSLESVLRPGDLIRGHAKWDEECTQCHVRFDRAAQNERCMNCHKEIAADVRTRSGYHGRLEPRPCRSCHTDHKGRDARIVELDARRFDHDRTDYRLLGRHRTVDCAKCHPAGRKHREAPLECVACHRKDDTHKGGLGTQCADCHAEDDWKKTRFDHDKTRFALTQRHAEVRCADCHRAGTSYRDAPRACVGCHRKDDDTARGHHGRFGEKCESCHGTRAWKPATFNHDTDTRYVLRGRHRTAACGTCHTGWLYRDRAGTTCVDCHRKDDRHEGGLGRDCQACHTERDWKETARFDHDRTRYALLGRHRDARCGDCHAAGRYAGTPTECLACHRKDDRHEGRLGSDCQACHSERDWKETARFDHQRSRFPLLGRHRDTRCADCHKSADYRAAPRDCLSCHRKDDRHEGTLGTACETCHGEQDWKTTRRFDHQRTRFALRNAHAARTVACKDCHADARRYRDTPRECIGCHRKDDRHEGQLGNRCEDCHTDTRWSEATYDHSRARFALLGRHLATDCKACHRSLRYRDAPRDCDGCHLKDDKHQRRYGSACESCHNARDWRLWAFDHNRRTRYVLDGAHVRTACDRCHTAPAPRGQPIAAVGSACIACHQRDDKHEGAFGSSCQRCHVTDNWRRITNRSDRGAAPPGRTGLFSRSPLHGGSS